MTKIEDSELEPTATKVEKMRNRAFNMAYASAVLVLIGAGMLVYYLAYPAQPFAIAEVGFVFGLGAVGLMVDAIVCLRRAVKLSRE